MPESTREKRYRLVCVAPEMPDMGSTDDLDEAFLMTCSYVGSHYEVFDTHTGENLGQVCHPDEEAEIRQRAADRNAVA